jgi:AcrR family transcriptional regulator
LAGQQRSKARPVPIEAFRPKRGRPTADQAQAISRSIMTAATQVFLAEGYERASMDAVAARAGVPKSTLYKRYPDKKALLRAVLRERLSAWSSAAPADDIGEDLQTRLEHYARTMLVRAMSGELRAFFNLAASAWSGPGEAHERRDAIGYTSMLDLLAREIRVHGPAHGVQAKDPRRVAGALMSMLTGWIQWDAPCGAEAEAEAAVFAHTAVGLLISGSAEW